MREKEKRSEGGGGRERESQIKIWGKSLSKILSVGNKILGNFLWEGSQIWGKFDLLQQFRRVTKGNVSILKYSNVLETSLYCSI